MAKDMLNYNSTTRGHIGVIPTPTFTLVECLMGHLASHSTYMFNMFKTIIWVSTLDLQQNKFAWKHCLESLRESTIAK